MRVLAIAISLFAIGLCASLAAASSPAPTPTTYTVEIENNAFNPKDLHVPVGSTVTWINKDPYGHTVTMPGKNGFDSGNLDSGKSYSKTFAAAGTYSYACSVHPSMTATVIVTGASPVPASSGQ